MLYCIESNLIGKNLSFPVNLNYSGGIDILLQIILALHKLQISFSAPEHVILLSDHDNASNFNGKNKRLSTSTGL